MPALRRSHWTVDEVDRLAEEHREPVPRLELVDGDWRLPATDDTIIGDWGRGRIGFSGYCREADWGGRLIVHLVIEVLSPGSARHDRITKRRFFQSHGVPAYWVVDGEAEAFEIWKPDDERAMLAAERFVWEPAGAPAPFVLDVERFFADVADGRSVAG